MRPCPKKRKHETERNAGLALPRAVDQRLRLLHDLLDILAVGHVGGEAERLGPKVEVGRTGRMIDARPHAVLIVDADEQHRQVPQRRHIHAFVENALLHRAVAEERDGDRIVLQPLRREPGADDVRDAAADDRVGARDARAPCRRCASSRPCRCNSRLRGRRSPPSCDWDPRRARGTRHGRDGGW